VATYFEQEHACGLASGIDGVMAVESHLTLADSHAAPPPQLAPAEGSPAAAAATDDDLAVAERIRARYAWVASLHDQAINVQVVQGRASLTGTVDTWLEHQQAAREAREAGAQTVENHLGVVECQSTCD